MSVLLVLVVRVERAGRRVPESPSSSGRPAPGPAGQRLAGRAHCSSLRTDCGAWLACASIAVPACDRIWFFVNSTSSEAMSVSRIRLSDADRFSTATLRLLMVCSNRFWYAPSFARTVETSLSAASSVVIADVALAVVVRDAADVAR